MQTYSLTITGIIVMVAGTLLVNYGFSEGCAGEITNQIPLIVGGVIAYLGRLRQGDINILGFKK